MNNNKMKSLKTFSIVALALPLLFASCSKPAGEDDKPTGPVKVPSTVISYVSTLDGTALFENPQIGAKAISYTADVMKKDASLVLLDRLDNTGLIPLMEMMSENKKWSANCFEGIKSPTVFESSQIVFNAPTRQISSYKIADDAYVTLTPQQVQGVIKTVDADNNVISKKEVSVKVVYANTRLKSAENVAVFVKANGTLSKMIQDNMNFLMIGTVKNDAFDALQKGTATLDKRYVVTEIVKGPEYTVFMLAGTRYWNLNSFKTVDLSSGLKAYEIDVKWS